MSQMLLPLLPGTLPPNVCYSGEQERLNAYAEVTFAVLEAGMAFYNYGDSPPSVANQIYPWLRTIDMRWYYFQGEWKTPVNYDANERRLYVGSTVDLETYDGGSPGVVTDTTGPMWVVDTNFAGRSPMAPGDIPTANPPKTLAVGENFGEGAHVQLPSELAPHTHPPATNYSSFAGFVSPGQPSSFEITGGSEIEKMTATGSTGDGEAMPVIHPVRGCYVIKWSGRLFRTV